MEIIRTRTLAWALAISMLVGTPALADELFADWDAGDDDGISSEEFGTKFAERGIYDSWDADDDGLLSEDEFNRGVFGRYDADASGVIEEPEFEDIGDDMGDQGFWDV
ncbi:MAG TPA: hypothetical protein VFQ06_14880 [Nitrospira sp.]|nr:hypothetical protein [Nitrospira sp.]